MTDEVTVKLGMTQCACCGSGFEVHAKTVAEVEALLTKMDERIEELEAKLAQPEQEPFGYITGHTWGDRQSEMVVKITREAHPEYGFTKPFYTTPPQRKPLTDEEVWDNDELMGLNAVMMLPLDYWMRMVRAIEAAHGIKGDA